MEESFDRDRHVRFLEMMYDLLPSEYQDQEINHLTLAFFVISGLNILRALDRESFMVFMVHGFQIIHQTKMGHLASTYCALAVLKIIGYDFALVDSESISNSMKSLQQPDGSFMPIHIGAEKDLRFVYCAAAICYILGNWNGVDREKAKDYILNCQSYDGGFGLTPGSESHGGATYCAIASLQLMGFIGDDILSEEAQTSIINSSLLLEWCLQRQAADGGFHGRPNKPSDTCYAFWIGGVLRILGGHKFIDETKLRLFLLTCQSKYGGFSKFPGQFPDLYHSYYGLLAFSLLEEPCLVPFCVELGFGDSAAT